MQPSNDQLLWISQPLEQAPQWSTQEQQSSWNSSQDTWQAEVFTQSQTQWPDSQQPYQLQPDASPEAYQSPSSWQPIPPEQQPSRKKTTHKRLWIALCIVVALFVIDGVAIYALAMSGNTSGNTTTTPSVTQAAATPTAAFQSALGKVLSTTGPSQRIQIQSFSGHLADGNWYHSKYFTVPDNWQVQWICLHGEESLPIVTVVGYDHSGNPIAGDDKIAAQGNCGEGFGVGAIQKHGGTIQLQIYAQGDFMVIVDALK